MLNGTIKPDDNAGFGGGESAFGAVPTPLQL